MKNALASSDGFVTEAVEAALPAIMMDARRAAASITMGEHGRRRAGSGDAFWQHREWTNGESLRQIDWRRSARSDKLYVRERERQVPALLQVWCDHRANMDWRGSNNVPTKAQRALVLGLALAIATRNGGERVSALGLNAPMQEEMTFARLLANAGTTMPENYKAGQVLLVSDGLERAEVWQKRAQNIAAARANLIVILVADRAEQDFPYQGRMSLSAGDGQEPLIVGRAQAAQADYQAAYRDHIADVRAAIMGAGGQVFVHVSDEPALPTLVKVAAALDGAAPRTRVA